MRISAFLLLLTLLAATGIAQQVAESDVPGRQAAATALHAEITGDTGEEVRRAETATAAQAALERQLDEAFWRHVLAGILVTVISALILRAIL